MKKTYSIENSKGERLKLSIGHYFVGDRFTAEQIALLKKLFACKGAKMNPFRMDGKKLVEYVVKNEPTETDDELYAATEQQISKILYS